jgi:hypothetical protein
MTSTGVATASMVGLRQPSIDSTGTSTVSWVLGGVETGTATMAGTSPPSLRGDFVLANNLVVNGNFDGGTFYGWNGGIGPTGNVVTTSPPGAYEGNFYLTPSSSGVFVSQYIDLTNGFSEAELSSGTAQLDMGMAAIKLFADTSAAAFMGGQWYTAGLGYVGFLTAISNNSLPLDTWTELSATVTIPATARILRLYVYDSGSSPDSHSFDAIYVRKAGTRAILEPAFTSSGSSTVTWGDPPVPPADPGTELLTNGGFEDDFTGWTEGTGGQYFPSSTTPPGAYEGTRYARIASTTFSTLNQQVDLHDAFDPSVISDGLAELYISAAYTKDGTDPNYSAEIDLAFYDSGLGLISSSNILSDTSITQDVWKTSGDIVESVPTNARYAEIILYSEDPDFFAFYDIDWDAVSMKANALPRPVLTSDGTASASFTANQITPITMGGTATATMSGGGTFPIAMSSAGVASTSLVGFPDYRIQSNGSATTSWSPIVSTAVTGTTTASFGAPASSEAVTMAGSSSVSWGIGTVEQGATFSIILSDAENQTVTSQNELSFEAQGSRGVVVWGAQVEYNRSRPSSFVSRTATSLRAADAYTIDNSKLPISDTTLSMFAEFKRNHIEAGKILSVEDGSDAIGLELDSSGQSLHRVTDDGGDVAYILDGVAAENTQVRLASSAQVNDAKLVVDSGSALVDTSLTMAATSSGTTFIGSGYDGIISRIMILPQASSEEALQGYGVPQDPPTYRYIEKLALKSEAIGGTTNKMADSGAFFAGPASTVTCAWLVERTDIVAWATNASGVAVPLTGLTSDVDGNIALGDTYTNIWVGLAYTARYRSGKLAFENQGGTALLQRKRIAELGLLLENTHRDAVRFGEDFDRMRHMNLVRAGAIQNAGTIYSTYDDKSFSFPGSWNTDSRLCLEIQAPYPATLLGLVIGLEWNERGLG